MMFKYLALTVGLLASTCTAMAPAYAGEPLKGLKVIIRVNCPGSHPMVYATDKADEAVAFLAFVQGLITSDEYLSWLEDHSPAQVQGGKQAILECSGQPA